jgi:two-component system nitrogen regulation sensor histidine kinase GlnL
MSARSEDWTSKTVQPAARDKARPDTSGNGHAGAMLAAMRLPVLLLQGREKIVDLNSAAEQFLGASRTSAIANPLSDFIAGTNPLFTLLDQVLEGVQSLSEHDMVIEGPKIGRRVVSVDVGGVGDLPGHLVLTLREHDIMHRLSKELSAQSSVRSAQAMAAMLGHEIKNPLSGIRGAAQLLEQNAVDDDRDLTRLICEETDRIRDLVDRVDLFSNPAPLQMEAVNIHEVLDHVLKLAVSGFARKVTFTRSYDPSLPAVHGTRDLLIQVILNLVKNAAEALPAEGGEINFSTRYVHGMRLQTNRGEGPVELPLAVEVRDNGQGIPADILPHLFEPFVTTKSGGRGLGLALAAKIVNDLGGVISCESRPRRTVMRLRLPLFSEPASARPDEKGAGYE